MVCAECGIETEKPEYFVCQVDRHIVLKEAGHFFKYQLDLYSKCEFEGSVAFSARRGKKLLTPHAIARFGDVYAYWCTPLSGETRFCSRKCAISFAASHNCLLVRRSDGTQITPQQAFLDEYAREHNLARHLALVQEDEWTTPEQEFLGLLSAQLQFPDRLLALASVMIDQGKSTLAERAIEKVVDEFPISVAAQHCAPILCKLGKHERVDSLFEELTTTRGGRANLPAEVRSSWAFGISTYNYAKALALSTEAIEANAPLNTIIENHIMLLSMHDADSAIEFFQKNSALVNQDVGFFAVGKAFLRRGLLPEAEENIRLSDLLLPDPFTKAYLAETLYRRGRYAEALETCRNATFMIEEFELRSAADFDGVTRNPGHYPYEQKKALRSALLAVEGKSLISIGEEEAGRQRVQDALDINLGFKSEDVFYGDLESLVRDYTTRTELQKRLAEEQQRLNDLVFEKRRSEITIGRLNDIISTLAGAQRDWQDALMRLKDAAGADFIAEQFSNKIHAFCMLLRRKEAVRYHAARDALQSKLPSLPARVIEQLANAEFLLDSHQDDALPVFAGVIIEYCKALETAVNEIVIRPFVMKAFQGEFRAELDVLPWSGRSRSVEVKYRGQPKSLMLNELILVLRSNHAGWVEFCNSDLGSCATWVRNELPNIVSRVKDDYRNGCAHSNSASRKKALLLKEYLGQTNVFTSLGDAAAVAQSRVRA